MHSFVLLACAIIGSAAVYILGRLVDRETRSRRAAENNAPPRLPTNPTHEKSKQPASGGSEDDLESLVITYKGPPYIKKDGLLSLA
jgi:hypothetical protein